MKEPLQLKRGDFVYVTYKQQTVVAMVGLASENGQSLALLYDGMLGGFVNMMPVLWLDGEYRDVVDIQIVTITRHPHSNPSK